MRRVLFFFLSASFYFFSTSCFAQKSDSLDNSFVETFHEYFFVGPVIKRRELAFNVSKYKDLTNSLSFKPNNTYSVGLSVNVFDLSLEASMSVPVDIKNLNRFGESTVKDIQIGALTKKFIFDAYWQKYSGFYYSYPTLNLLTSQVYPQRSDIDTRNLGFSFAYVFNNEKFSLRSSYTFIDRQLKSKGSFILGFIVSSFDIHADSSLVPFEFRKTNWKSTLDASRVSSLGLAPGYSYNLVYNKLFFNVTLSVGPAHYWIRYHLKDQLTRDDIEINTYSALRVALGYNGDRFFTGVSYNQQGRNVTFDEIKLSNQISTFRFVMGYRFKEFGLLKKRALDFAPGVRKRS